MVMWPSQSQIGILLLLMLCATTSRTGIWGMKMQCNEMDRQKLLGFKQEVMDSIGMLSTWSIRQDCCGWAGVECDHFTHRVTKLSLPCPVIKDDTDCLADEYLSLNLTCCWAGSACACFNRLTGHI
ncbi:hypothetical protein L6164_023276 [Bauhinia variegata]|uniref:Uncharacterized protein n=2 Tax=Bauhinia variegata TaxID=167791 RepID=A0ACB9MJM4_BAUVA|nr:hypothetical protein L6164_023275 [Bauhinia variegata]KAI4323689.1 hypothetical protein L6164_023276 [Bauhinia variegata]